MDLIIYGFGGHGKVVIDLARLLGYSEIGIFDELCVRQSPTSDFTFLGAYNEFLHIDVPLVLTMGDNAVRMHLSRKVRHKFATMVHPSASISSSASIGHGTVVLQNAVVQAGTVIGRHCIINAGAVVDHDSYVSDFCHLRPHCYIAGASRLSELTTIDPSITVPRNSTI